MKLNYIIFFITIGFLSTYEVQAQESTSIAKALGLFVFPSEGQEADTQELEEFQCYKWAREQTGVDPINPPEVKAEQVVTSPDGTAVVGAAKGAAAGAAVGAIAGDAGKGAAIGAVLGGMRGRRSKKHSDAVQQQQANQAAEQTEQEMMNNFKKAFAACLEGKGYTVK